MKIKLLALLLLISAKGLCQAGEIDATFGINGKLTTGFGNSENWANAFALQADGKFLVGGTYVSGQGYYDFALARYTADGSLDTSFGTDGKVTTHFFTSNNSTISSIYILPNGKIMAFGNTGLIGAQLAIVRYNADGSIDTTFGDQGKLLSELAPATQYGNKLVFQTDGKFIITGQKLYNFDPNLYLGVERYSEDGVPDTTFGTNGQAVTSFGTGQSVPTSMILQPDGKIVIAGYYYSPQPYTLVTGVVRYDTNGILDTAFDGDGKVTTGFGTGTSSIGGYVSLNPAGKIIVASAVTTNTSRNLGLAQYNANGSLDTSFDSDGKALSPFDLLSYSSVNSITTQPDGKFLVVAYSDDSSSPTSDFVTRRYNADGAIDTAFGNNGTAQATFDTGLNMSHSAFVTAAGDIYVVGKSVPADYGHTNFGIAKYNSSGILDVSLNGDGKVATAFEQANDKLGTMLVLPNDKIIAIGISGRRRPNNSMAGDIAISKYNSDGSPDTAFGVSGKVVSAFDDQVNSVLAAALQPDGKIVVSNTYYHFLDTTNSNQLLRYNADGSLDSSFGNNGAIAIGFSAKALIVQADGKIIAVWDEAFDSVDGTVVARFNNDGTADNSFGGDGSMAIAFGANYFATPSIAVQADGKIIVSNTISLTAMFGAPLFATARVNADGTLDNTFGTAGIVTSLIGDTGFAYATFIQPDGKTIVAGKSFSGAYPYLSSVRYDSNGTLDAAYGTNGISSSQLFDSYKETRSIVLQPDGKLLVALSQSGANADTNDFVIRRFNPDGTYDPDFGGMYGIATSFYNGYDEAFSIGLQSDNKVIVAGTTYNGINYDFALARYDNIILGVPEFGDSPATPTLIVYPNPAKDILNIKSQNSDLQIIDYKISNMLGQLVYQGKSKDMIIDTRNLDRGIYTLLLETNKGIFTKKFIKE